MGFNYPNNRWTYVFAFIFAFISTSFLNKDYTLRKKDLLVPLISIIIFLSINAIMENNLSKYIEIQILLSLIWLIIIYFKDNIKKISKRINMYNLLLTILITVGIGFSIKFIYDISFE